MTEKNKQTETQSTPEDKANTKTQAKTPKNTQQAKPEATVATPAQKHSSWLKGTLKLLLVLIILAAISAAGWVGWLQWQDSMVSVNASAQQVSRLQSSVATLEKQHRQNLVSQAEQLKTIQQLQHSLAGFQLRLNAFGGRLSELGSTTRSDWLLAEALNLTRLANHRLQTERSPRNPMALLTSVDKILLELDDQELLPVRSAIMADMNALRLAGQVDHEGIFLALDALIKTIAQLEIYSAYGKTAELPASENAKKKAQQLQTKEFGELATGFASQLRQLITIRHREQPIEPLLQPAEETLVRQNLRLMLEQSQTALLREQQAVYSASLNKAREWLAVYFQHSAEGRIVEEQLADLAATKIVQQLPPINGSLEALENYLLVRQSRLTNINGSESER